MCVCAPNGETDWRDRQTGKETGRQACKHEQTARQMRTRRDQERRGFSLAAKKHGPGVLGVLEAALGAARNSSSAASIHFVDP